MRVDRRAAANDASPRGNGHAAAPLVDARLYRQRERAVRSRERAMRARVYIMPVLKREWCAVRPPRVSRSQRSRSDVPTPCYHCCAPRIMRTERRPRAASRPHPHARARHCMVPSRAPQGVPRDERARGYGRGPGRVRWPDRPVEGAVSSSRRLAHRPTTWIAFPWRHRTGAALLEAQVAAAERAQQGRDDADALPWRAPLPRRARRSACSRSAPSRRSRSRRRRSARRSASACASCARAAQARSTHN